MAGLPRADIRVSRVRRPATHVTGLNRIHSLEIVEYGLQAPETASGKSGDFLPCVGHVVSPFFAVGVLFCRIKADHITVCRIRSAGQARRVRYRPSEESNMSLLRSLLAAALLAQALPCAAQQAAPKRPKQCSRRRNRSGKTSSHLSCRPESSGLPRTITRISTSRIR